MLRNAYKDFPMYQITERHPHAELMVTAPEIAKNRYDWWEEFDWRLNKEHEWLPMAEDSFYEKYDYRLKPRTIKISNREINAPEREPLKEAEIYYTPQFDGSLQTWHRWNNSGYDQYLLKNSLIFLTKEDAIAAAEAMIALLSGE
ncbi:hypothetical protein [Arsenophonus sp. PmNCSU2021_1]|uniref:hypothetical protein n=1 Tax=Arsenophonus sp. PmNCSU2021_1 TaxID=3118989 RepID=UPI002FF239B5